jgi:CheY-like chemotaxis protein/membrane protease YdiL (CAAX protease family)
MKTVLLADDLTFTRVVISRTIRSIGDCKVIEVESGEQALEVLRNNSEIDVIVTDIMMSPINGLELLKMVRADKTAAARDIPYVIISGAITEEIQSALDYLDVTDAVAKPASKSRLTKAWSKIETDIKAGGRTMRPAVEYEAIEVSHLLNLREFDQAKPKDITDDPNKLMAFLGAVPLLNSLKHSELELLGRQARTIHYSGGEVIDGEVFGTTRLPLISMGEAEFLQPTELPDGEVVEHRVAHLEAGNALGTFNFMNLADDYKHPKVRTIRATDAVVLEFDDPDPNSALRKIKLKVEFAIGQILTRRVSYADKSLAMVLTQQLAESRVKRTAGGYVILMFVLLAIYTLGMRTLLDIELKGSARTISSVVMILTFLVPFIIMLRKGSIKAVDLGLTFRGAGTAVRDALFMSSIFIGVLVACKFLLVTFAEEYSGRSTFALSQDFARLTPTGDIDWIFYASNVVIYALFVPVQEIIARCGIQSLLVEFLYGSDRRRAVIAIIVSNFVFAAAHTHLNVGFALATFAGGLFFGWLFHRNRSIVGVSVSHFMIGGAALFALGLEGFLK